MRLASAIPLVAVSFFSSCADSGAVSDAEVDAIKTARSSLVTADEFARPGVLHVRLAWGLLAWADRGAKESTVDWTGSAALSSGTATLDMTTFFEKGDAPVEGAANEVKWASQTHPHFDGVVATLEPSSADDTFTITTPGFTKALTAADLNAAGELRFSVDDAGHEFSISALPDEDASCSYFVVGFSRGAHFKGLALSNLGDRQGKLRFEVSDGAITADLLDTDGAVIDSGAGALDEATQSFTIALGKSTLTGLYTPASYASRGSFQASARCAN